ncbi:MAG: hypothetical protein R3B09_09365 [Nannocystaceae bacterium]
MAPTRIVSSCLVAAAVAAAPTAAHAAQVRLHVQAPYDLATKTFNLEQLETQNLTPAFARTFEVPYATLEPLLAAGLEDVVGRTLHFKVKCYGLGIDELCPDTDITVKIHSSFKFTQKGQPTVTSLGAAADNKVRVKLDAQARVALDVSIHHKTGIWYSGSETIDIFALVGAHGQVDLKLWPTVGAEGLDVKLTHDGGNIDINGLSGQIIAGGAILGGALLGPIGAAFGAILGSIGADAAEDAIKDAINGVITEQLNAANVQLRDQVAGQIDPLIAQAVDYQQKALNTKIPAIGLTVAQALAVGPASLDVRTVSANNSVRTVVTTRFDATGQGKSLQGVLRFPKTTCRYAEGGNKTIGHFKFPIAVDPINDDLAGKSCAALISGASFARSAYLGESPEKLLNSGKASNDLPSWTSTGGISTTGVAVDKGDYYECPYTLSNLPGAAILELATVKGSDLHARLDAHAFRGRYLFMALAGPVKLLDAEGKPKAASPLVFGGKGPKTTGDCPSSFTGGTGFQQGRLGQIKDRFDPEKCPMCGLLDFFNDGDLYANPGVDVNLAGVASKAQVTKAVSKADAEVAAQGALEGVQRVQKVLDGGVLKRSWAAVDKARAGVARSTRGATIKQVGKLGPRSTFKVFDGAKTLPVKALRIEDNALPVTEVEVKLQGKTTGK